MSSKLLRGDLELDVAPLHRAIVVGDSGAAVHGLESAGNRGRDAEQREKAVFKQGAAEGRLAAQQEYSKRIAPLEQQLGQILQRFSAIQEEIRCEAEDDLVTLAFAIARRVLHREVSMDREAVAALARAAMERVAGRSLQRVRTHPDHQEVVAAIIAKRCIAGSVQLVADPTLQPGDLIFETQRAELDASVEAQLDEIRRGLVDGHGRAS